MDQNNFAVTTHGNKVVVWTATEWESVADTLVNTSTDWCATRQEAENLAARLRDHYTPRDS